MPSHQRPLIIVYKILSLTNSTLLTGDMVLLCMKTLYLIHNSESSLCRKMYIHLLVGSPTKSNLYVDISFATVMTEPAIYKPE
jgi:hypothetical protein